MNIFTGSIVALVTPMDRKGNICRSSLKKLIDYHLFSETTAIVSAGTTGESSSLNDDEYYRLVMMSLELSNGRIPIISGIGANSTAKAIKLVQRLNNSGVSGYLIVTPYYNCPTQEGLFQHFRAISEHTNLPQILYNVPYRTGCDILPETVGYLSKIKNIVGIKEATGNLARVHQIKKLVSDDFILLSGDDITALDFIQLGGNGVISVTANIAAQDMTQMCRLAIAGFYQKARLINHRLTFLHEKLFFEPNPIPVKWACKKLGLIKTDTVRLPMTPLTIYGRKVIKLSMRRTGLI